MPATATSIEQLNAVLKHMLTGINQFFLHARILKHRGELALADQAYRSSIDAMRFSDMLVEHMLQLGGVPNMSELGQMAIGDTPAQMVANDCAYAEATLALIREAMGQQVNAQTAELLKRIAEHQQEYVAALRALLSSPQPLKDCA